MMHPLRGGFARILGFAGAIIFLWPAATAGAAASEHPNIVFILADDMGYGDLSCQNPETKIPTPRLDRLAAKGMRFADAHSPSAVCSPTRYGILTGRYCWRTRLKKGVLWPFDKPLIEEGRLTVARLLKGAGYHTACIGKWHLGWNWPARDGAVLDQKSTGESVDFTRPITGGPTALGFDYYFGDDVPNFQPYCFIENDRTIGIPAEMKPDSMFGHRGVMVKGWKLDAVMPAIARKATAYIRERAEDPKGRPFFLYFALTAPHTPIAPAKAFQGKSRAGAYGDYVFEVDWSVGEVLRALKECGFAENTLVLFTSDNGSPGRDGTNRSGPINSVRHFGHNPSRPWRGIKSDAWEGGHRVPFLARWPGRVPAGSVCDALVCHADFLATAAAILGETLPGNAAEDSFNLLPLLEGKARDDPPRKAVIHHSGGGLFCVRQGQWKLILGLGPGGFSGGIRKPKPGEPKGQLYDLQADPGEQKNLYNAHPDVVRRLSAMLDGYRKSGRSAPLD